MASASLSVADGYCCICLESLDKDGLGRQSLPCSHVMHELCIMELRRRGSSGCCPICRIGHTDLTPVQTLMDRAAICVMQRSKKFEESIRLWNEVLQIEPSNAAASYNLGLCYFFGHGISPDRIRAEQLWHEACQAGHTDAKACLANIYKERGDMPKAMELYGEARQGGSAEAASNLGDIFLLKGDHGKAVELYHESRRGGNARATYRLGLHSKRQGDFVNAVFFLLEAHGRGVAESTFSLGTLYQEMGQSDMAKFYFAEARRRGGVQVQERVEVWENSMNGSAAAEGKDSFIIGDHVKIHDLASAEGCKLNGLLGTVVKFDPHTSRYGVKVDGFDKAKAIQSKNLTKIRKSSASREGIMSAAAQTPGHFAIADRVRIHGLTSPAGIGLNGSTGKIIKFDAGTGRYVVGVDDVPVMQAIQPSHLCLHTEQESSSEHFTKNTEDESVQTGTGETMSESKLSDDAGRVNAQLSEALVRSSLATDGPRVLLLKLSRSSEAMRRLLLESEELAHCRAALESQGVAVELASGAKIFVRPEHYVPVHEALRLHSMTLYNDHVIVDVDLEPVVTELVRSLRGRSNVYPKRTDILPLGFASAAASMNGTTPVVVDRTFINIRVPSSLYTESDPTAPRTASTTDADPRKHVMGPSVRSGTSGAGIPPQSFSVA